jgi:aspartate/methionine/tyrosine aminotransferase
LKTAHRHHEYHAIAANAISCRLAESALHPDRRDELLRRGRAHIRAGYARLDQWISQSDGLLSIVEPQATAAGFVRYRLDIPSLDVAHAIRIKAKTLVGVGSHFGAESHLRIGHTVDREIFDAGMAAIIEVLQDF